VRSSILHLREKEKMISLLDNNLYGTSSHSNSASSFSGNGFLSKYCLELPLAITALTETNHMTPLDQSYKPGMYDVVCGRGKGSYNRPGNKRFRSLVATYIPQYVKARSKLDKSIVLNNIIDKVRSFTNPDTGSPAQFVKYTKSLNTWVLIGDEHAREKVGHAIREAIAAQEQADNNLTSSSTSSISPSPTQLVEDDLPTTTVSLNKAYDDILCKQQSFLDHFRTVQQRSNSLTSFDMKAAVDSLVAGA
jgi:hypothetical protein